MIGKVLRTAKSNDDAYIGQDFIVFLENVVRADCQSEDGDHDDDAKKTAKQRDRATFFAEKYGDKTMAEEMKKVMQAANRFSLSRVEWLDGIYTTPE